MKIHELKPADGANRRNKRVARGPAGRGGKTAGRGTKGQHARNTVPDWFEGGQMPLHMRVPKLRGFANPFRVEYQGANLDTIEDSGLDEVTPEALRAKGIARKGTLIKILGRGRLTRPVKVSAHAFSASAAEAVTDAGGTVEKLPLPFRGRPPAKGNALRNR